MPLQQVTCNLKEAIKRLHRELEKLGVGGCVFMKYLGRLTRILPEKECKNGHKGVINP